MLFNRRRYHQGEGKQGPTGDPGPNSGPVGAEDGFDEGVGIEWLQVFDLFAYADEAHGQFQFTADGDGHSTLGRAVELG